MISWLLFPGLNGKGVYISPSISKGHAPPVKPCHKSHLSFHTRSKRGTFTHLYKHGHKRIRTLPNSRQQYVSLHQSLLTIPYRIHVWYINLPTLTIKINQNVSKYQKLTWILWVSLFFSLSLYIYIYLEPKWPFSWLEKILFGGFNHQNKGHSQVPGIYIYAYIYMYIYKITYYMHLKQILT